MIAIKTEDNLLVCKIDGQAEKMIKSEIYGNAIFTKKIVLKKDSDYSEGFEILADYKLPGPGISLFIWKGYQIFIS